MKIKKYRGYYRKVTTTPFGGFVYDRIEWFLERKGVTNCRANRPCDDYNSIEE